MPKAALMILLALALAMAGCAAPEETTTDTTEDDSGDSSMDGGHMDGATDGMDGHEGHDMSDKEGFAPVMAKAMELAALYPNAQAAWDAGYRPDTFCIPGMGNHWIHMPGQPESYFDTMLEEDKPEVLLFQPADASGNWTNDTLVGVEWVVVTQGTEMNTTETVPQLYGVPFHGPMPGHFPGMPWHAELHVYIGEHAHSDESLPEMHDAVVCPEGTTPPPPAGTMEANTTSNMSDENMSAT